MVSLGWVQPQTSVFFSPDFPRDNCTEGDIRISEVFVSGDLNSGLVEVCQRGIWQKVCNDEFFNANAANVVCRHLGFEFYGGMPYTQCIFRCINYHYYLLRYSA